MVCPVAPDTGTMARTRVGPSPAGGVIACLGVHTWIGQTKEKFK